MQDRPFYKISNSGCSAHKYMKQPKFYGAVHASSNINAFLVNTYSLFALDDNSTMCQTYH